MRTIILLFIAFAFFACEEDQPQPPIPDCYDPKVLPSLLHSNTNAFMTNHDWEFYEVSPGGSTPPQPATDTSTHPHILHFDTLGLYYVVRNGDTVQSGRVMLYEMILVAPAIQRIELFPDCVEDLPLLKGFYDMRYENSFASLKGYYNYGLNPTNDTQVISYFYIN